MSGDGQVGQAVAKALADAGVALAICARTQSNVEVRAKELQDAGETTHRVRVAHRRLIAPQEFSFIKGELRLN